MTDVAFDAGTGPADDVPLDQSAAGGDPAGEGEETSSSAEAVEVRPKPERMVSLAALHAERSRRKEVDRERRELLREVGDLRERFRAIEQANAPPPSEPGDIAGVVRATNDTVAELKQRFEQREAMERAVGVQQELVGAYRNDAALFEAQTPDFRAAYDHLLQSRAQELIALGYDDPQALQSALVADELALAQAALNRGQSPAEVLYTLARQRGYVPAAQARGAGRMETIARGRDANKSFAQTGGGSGDAEISAEALLRMPMDEFDAWCARNPARARRLMGG